MTLYTSLEVPIPLGLWAAAPARAASDLLSGPSWLAPELECPVADMHNHSAVVDVTAKDGADALTITAPGARRATKSNPPTAVG